MFDNYTPYHIHTMLSNGVTNIDSVSTYSEYIDLAVQFGMKAFGFSEHGSILEHVHKKLAIEKAGMKYIHAEEFYVTEKIDVENLVRDNYHTILIAKNYDGVKELNKLSSKSFYRDGHFYYQPRISFDELKNTSDNIIITTACVGGIFGCGNIELKKEFLQFLIKNKHRCFLEIQHHLSDEQIKYNKYIYEIHKKTGIRLIAGTDSHAAKEIDLDGRDIMQKSKNVKFSGEDEWDLTFMDYDSLVKKYHKQNSLPENIYLEAIENTNVMADMIEEYQLDFSHKYPVLYKDSKKVFLEKIKQGIIDRGINKLPNYDEYKERIISEIKTYIHNGAIDFMLLEEDYKRALRERGVVCGYSRGSVSGSLIAYLLHITEVDSVKYNLNFSRFMNPERVSLADIDTDWFDTDRDKVREYLFNKDGLSCCNIITFNTIKLRGAIKDVGRALGYSPSETQEICNAVEEDDDENEFISDKIKEKYPDIFKYVDIVKGTITALGRHAAGLVVSPIDVEEAFGTLRISSDPRPISQINMKEIDLQNFLKLDILGLDCIGLIKQTCDLANISFLTPRNTDYNDMNVWNDLKNDTTMVFQYESGYSSDYLKQCLSDETIKNIKKINPNFSYIDIMSMANGAIRPAGASYREELSHGIFRDNGNKELNDFLSPTLGYLVYQEQIIEFLHKFCGFTMGEADVVRRHFSKKTGTENDIPIIKDGGYMINNGIQSNHYIKGFLQTMQDDYEVSKEESEKIIENFLQVIIDASDYLFSYNHALPYSFLGYTVAYLKHYYPLETYTTALNIYRTDAKKMTQITALVKSIGITVYPIKFGRSRANYVMDKSNHAINKGIESIKYCNAQIADELMTLSKENQYDNYIDLLKDIKDKTSVNSRQLEILTGLNFFSDFGGNAYLLQVIDLFDKFYNIKQVKKDKMSELGLDEYIMQKVSGKETAKLYKDINWMEIVNMLSAKLEDKSFGVVSQMRFEKEHLEYVDYIYPKAPEDIYVIIDYVELKDTTKPRFTARRISDGEEMKARIKQSKVYKKNPFGLWSVLRIPEFSLEFKRKPNANGEWVVTNEMELILNQYEVLKR